jgi:hypothetical protein
MLRLMAQRTVIYSDLSSTELDDSTHARVVVKHPDQIQPLELDISTDEAGKLVNTTLRLVELQVFEPNKPPRTVQMETKVLDKLFDGVDFDKVLEAARVAPLSKAAPATRKTSAPKAAAGDKIDYTSPDHYGQLHRGRLTDQEKELVKNNMEQASRNREAQTGNPINWDDPKERSRYGFDITA